MFSSLTSWSCKKRKKFQFTVTPVNCNRKKKYALQSSFTCILTFSPLKKISDFFLRGGGVCTQPKFGGALRDDTKNGCVADYLQLGRGQNFSLDNIDLNKRKCVVRVNHLLFFP